MIAITSSSQVSSLEMVAQYSQVKILYEPGLTDIGGVRGFNLMHPIQLVVLPVDFTGGKLLRKDVTQEPITGAYGSPEIGVFARSSTRSRGLNK